MRILQVAPFAFPAPWGTPVYVEGLSRSLVARGHEVCVVASSAGDRAKTLSFPIVRPRSGRSERGEGVRFSAGGWQRRQWQDLVSVRSAVRRLLREQRWDILYAHQVDGPWLASEARGRSPLIYGHHAVFSEELRAWFPGWGRGADAVGAMLDRAAVWRADASVALSRRAEDQLRAIGARNILYNPPGVDLNSAPGGDAERARQRWSITGRPWLGYFGNLDPYQDLDRLLAIAARMPEVGLVVCSPGDVAPLHAAAARAGIGLDRRRFIGGAGLSELCGAMAAVEVAVVPRWRCSGVPMKILNQLAMGVPTLASAWACDPFPGVIRLVSPDPSAWVSELRRLLDAPMARRQLSEDGRDFAARELTWEAHVARLERFCIPWTDPNTER
jgi:glycosyltransferase involved in cell wall biosynthesis